MTEQRSQNLILVLDDHYSDRQTYFELLASALKKQGYDCYLDHEDRRENITTRLESGTAPTPSIIIVDYVWQERTDSGEMDDFEAGHGIITSCRTAYPDARIVSITRVDVSGGNWGIESIKSGADQFFTFKEFFTNYNDTAGVLLGRLNQTQLSGLPSMLFEVKSAAAASCELLVTDIVDSSSASQDVQAERVIQLTALLDSICSTSARGEMIRHQFTGDGMIIAMPSATPGTAFRIASEFEDQRASLGCLTRTIVHAGNCMQLTLANRQPEVLGYSVNDACLYLAAIQPHGLFVSGTYYSTVLANGKEAPEHSFGELRVSTKKDADVDLWSVTREG